MKIQGTLSLQEDIIVFFFSWLKIDAGILGNDQIR